jgi:hypothetical protein
MKTKILPVFFCLSGLLATPFSSLAQPVLIMQDSPADTGDEPDNATDPSVNPGGEMFVSQDIWVTQTPMAGYTPYPFPTASPPMWLTASPNPNQNPQYRDPLLGQPNYLYVRISNIGLSQSQGTEELHVYWAKASTGLSWPNQWVDYMDSICGPSRLYGIEITKPRRNIADPSVQMSEVQKYLSAINAIARNASFRFPDGIQYWYKQNAEHYFVATRYLNGPTLPPDKPTLGAPAFAPHDSDGFWPWHREFVNRYETLLRQADPTVTLFYWDWTTNPTNWPTALKSAVTAASPNGIGGFNGQIASAFTNAANIKTALSKIEVSSSPAVLNNLVVSRFTARSPTYALPESTPDATITGKPTFSDARIWDEGFDPSTDDEAHNYSHEFIGGGGNMDSLAWAAQDPFFFLLHANVDKHWSVWQRAETSRFDPSATGGNAMAYAGSMNYMNQPMAPWNGLTYNGTIPMPPGDLEIVRSPLTPWTQSPGDQTMFKSANDNSVVFPPIYDVAPLTIPVLQPGESVVIEIPWYPPNPLHYSCFGSDSGHVCLLARITTNSAPPFGMDNPETTDINYNVKYNNKIAWRNETVLDGGISPPGPLINDAVFVRSLSAGALVRLDLSLTSVAGKSLANFGSVLLDLGATLYGRWFANGSAGSGFVPVGGTSLQLTGTSGYVGNIPMNSNELDRVEVQLVLSNGYPNPQGKTFSALLTQYGGGVTSDPNEPVGGQRFTFDFNQLDLVPKRSAWRYWDTGQDPGTNWNRVEFDDSQWVMGTAKLGYGLGDEATVLSSGPVDASYITTWFRYDFAVNDPSFFTNLWLQLEAYDGAVVYLNGVEIARQGMPNLPVSPSTPASAPVTGLAAETFYPFNVSSFLPLLANTNVLAVEVHVADTNNSAELGLDLELSGNIFAPSFPPQASLLAPYSNSPPNNGLYLFGHPITLTAAAVATANPVQSVSYYSDGVLLGTASTPPFSFTWTTPPLGVHQVTVQPTDTAGLSSQSFVTLTVLTNVPPIIYMVNPYVGQTFPANSPITLTASAQEFGGNIQKVDFYYVEHSIRIDSPQVLAGTANAEPYTIQLSSLAPGTYMVSAVATDDRGVRSYAVPVHICVVEAPTLKINYAQPYVILTWTPTNALLQQSFMLSGPWQYLTNATTPYGFIPDQTNGSAFFRVTIPTDATCRAP